MSNLLISENPLLVIPELARRVGLNEAIVLQQIHYWNGINKKAKNNLKDGHYWTYSSYDEWQKQFPFWSIPTIRRVIGNLERYELVITANYNKLKIDRTKWYRINYEALENLGKFPCDQYDQSICSKWYEHWINMSRPLPETYTEINTEITNEYKTPKQVPVIAPTYYFYSKSEDESVNLATDALRYYYDRYKESKGKDHPALKEEQLEKVYDNIMSIEADLDEWESMIEYHFERTEKNGGNDLNVNAFVGERNLHVLQERLRCGYLN